MTNERGLNETPEERAARIQAAKDRAAAARAARESGAAPPAAAAAAAAPVANEAPVVSAAAPAPPADDRPRTVSGTLKRDPSEPKKEAPATPEERAARIAAAKAAAQAAAAARAAGGGAAQGGPRPGAVEQPAPEDAAEEGIAATAIPGDGRPRTAKGTLKRDPNEPKKEAPATPEERAARIAAAKAAAAAAKERAAAAPAPTVAAAPAAAVRRAAAGPSTADQAAFRQAYEAVTRPLPVASAPPLRPVPSARAERPGAATEFPLSPAAEAAVAAFREAMPEVEFQVLTSPIDPILVVHRAEIPRVMERAKNDPRLDMKFLRSITAVDQMPEGIEVVYHLKSLTTKHAVEIKTMLPAHDLVVDSVTSVWLGANWHERELMEMFGVRCAGHPDPRNLLLDEDMTIHPLLKAHPLQDLEAKQGVNIF